MRSSTQSTTQPIAVRFDQSPLRLSSTESSGRTFGSYAEQWIEIQLEQAHAGLIRANTISRFESALRAHLIPFFAAYPLSSVTRERCEAFRTALYQTNHLAPRTINGLMEVLRLVLRRAIQDGAMPGPDPTLGIRPLWSEPRRVDCYSPAEVSHLLIATPNKYRAIVALAVLAGLRQGEIHGLRAMDIDLIRATVHVRRSLQRPHRLLSLDQRLGPPKTPAAVRSVPLRASLVDILDEHFTRHHRPNSLQLAFPGKAGQPLEPSNFRHRVYQPAAERAGLRPISFHDLRVTFITQCAEAGIPIVVIARWVGHTTTKTTELYLYSTRHAEQDALSLLRQYDSDHDATTLFDPSR
jgi:integrase